MPLGIRQNCCWMKKKKPSLFIRKGQTTTLQRNENTQEPPNPLNIYRSIYTLPLRVFRLCVVDKDLKGLVISGNATAEALTAAWNNILLEYAEAIGEGEYKIYISLYREVSALKNDYDFILNLIEGMRTSQRLYNEFAGFDVLQDEVIKSQKSIAKKLNAALRLTCSFNPKDEATFQEELNKCTRRTSGLKMKLDVKTITYNALKKKDEGGEKSAMDHSWFDNVLVTISDYAKYDIDENISVSKFCERIKRYNAYCETLEKKPKK